jgi:hypothetical protein
MDAGTGKSRVDELRRERVELEVARAAIARGDAASALDALTRQAALYPNGRLTEEREALTIQALVLAGHLSEARGRAAEFRARFPTSVFLPSLDKSLEGR